MTIKPSHVCWCGSSPLVQSTVHGTPAAQMYVISLHARYPKHVKRQLRPAKVGVTKGSPKETEPADVPNDADHARDSQQAYESKGEEPGTQLDEEL